MYIETLSCYLIVPNRSCVPYPWNTNHETEIDQKNVANEDAKMQL